MWSSACTARLPRQKQVFLKLKRKVAADEESSAWTPFRHTARSGCCLGRTTAGRGLLHAIEQLFQGDSIVVLRVPGSIDQRDLGVLVYHAVEFFQLCRPLRCSKLLEISFLEDRPVGARVKPLPQCIRRSKVLQPVVDPGALFLHATGHRRSTSTRWPS